MRSTIFCTCVKFALTIVGISLFISACTTINDITNSSADYLRSATKSAGDSNPAPSRINSDVPKGYVIANCPALSYSGQNQMIQRYLPGQENETNGLLYQATIDRSARSCDVVAGQFLIKVGIAGKVLNGPVAERQNLTLPLLVKITKNDKTVFEKVFSVAANIEPPNSMALFSTVNTISVAGFRAHDRGAVYIGFAAQPR